MRLRGEARQVQPEAAAAGAARARRVAAIERLAEVLDLVRRNARTLVGHAESPTIVVGRDLDVDGAAVRRRVAERVGDQVLHDQRQTRFVDLHTQVGRSTHLDAPAVGGEVVVDDALDEFPRGNAADRQRHVPSVQPLRLEQRGDDLFHLRDVGAQAAHVRTVVGKLEREPDPRQRRAQLVADAEQQLSFCVEHALHVVRHAVDVGREVAELVVAGRADTVPEVAVPDPARALADRRDRQEQPAHGKVGQRHQHQREAGNHRSEPALDHRVRDPRRCDDHRVGPLIELQEAVAPVLGELHALEPLQPVRRRGLEHVAATEAQLRQRREPGARGPVEVRTDDPYVDRHLPGDRDRAGDVRRVAYVAPHVVDVQRQVATDQFAQLIVRVDPADRRDRARDEQRTHHEVDREQAERQRARQPLKHRRRPVDRRTRSRGPRRSG